MKNRYDGHPGKDAAMRNTRQARFESEHSRKNAFVKGAQMATEKYAGTRPKLKDEALAFNAYMCNDGEHAQDFAKKVTAGLDKVAFPVDGEGDDS